MKCDRCDNEAVKFDLTSHLCTQCACGVQTDLIFKCPECGLVLDTVKVHLQVDEEALCKNLEEHLVEEIRKQTGEKL